jgi:hypothetical protein
MPAVVVRRPIVLLREGVNAEPVDLGFEELDMRMQLRRAAAADRRARTLRHRHLLATFLAVIVYLATIAYLIGAPT